MREAAAGAPVGSGTGHGRSARGYTLLEVLLASGLTAVLMAGLGSVFVVSALALPASGKVEVDLLAASRVAGRIAAEASYATRINAATKTVLDFEVADRNSDGAVESIRYEWGGNAGDALKRAMNGSAASDVLENVRDADFSLTTVPEVIASGGGGEILLFKCDGGTRGSSAVSGANCRGQFFAPWLPAGAAAWRPTRVLLRLGQNGPGDSKVTVNVKESLVTLLPGLVQLGTVTICEAALPATPGWVECAFPHAVWALAATNGCVEIKMGTGGNYATIEFGQNVTISGGAILSSSTNGALWGSTPTSQLCIQVYGEATTLGTVAGTTLDAVLGGGSTTRTLATRLDVSVAAGPESALGTAAAVMVNRPEVP